MKSILLLLITCIALITPADSQENRIWTYAKTGSTCEGILQTKSPDGSEVQIKRKDNGRVLSLKMEMLIEEDQRLINAWQSPATTSPDAINKDGATLADPTIRFRWLQTDPNTADAIVEALKKNDLSVDAFDSKLALQITNGKIIELAASERRIDDIRNFSVETAEHKGTRAIVMEAEATLLQGGLLALRCITEWKPNFPEVSGWMRCTSSSLLSSKHWSLYARWGDTSKHTLLLACGGPGVATARSETAQAIKLAEALKTNGVVIHLDVEWREIPANHFAELTETPPNEIEAAEGRVGRVLRPASVKPENLADAVAWLRTRSSLLASFTSTNRNGQASAQEQFWDGESLEPASNQKESDGTNDAPPLHGITLRWEPTYGEDTRRPFSMRLEASYVPLDARSKSEGTDFKFLNQAMLPGVPVIYGSKEAPKQGKPVVLVITPWFEFIR